MYTNIKQAGIISKAKTGLAIVGGMKLHQMYQDSKVGAKIRHMNELQKQSSAKYVTEDQLNKNKNLAGYAATSGLINGAGLTYLAHNVLAKPLSIKNVGTKSLLAAGGMLAGNILNNKYYTGKWSTPRIKEASVLAESAYQDALEKCASVYELLEKDAGFSDWFGNKQTAEKAVLSGKSKQGFFGRIKEEITGPEKFDPLGGTVKKEPGKLSLLKEKMLNKSKNKVNDNLSLFNAPKEGNNIFNTAPKQTITSTAKSTANTAAKSSGGLLGFGKKAVNGINRVGGSKFIKRMGSMPLWVGSAVLATGAGMYAAHKNSTPADAYNNAYNN